ncbi:MAG: folylpolyglutamate synthase/dihydrofolate synthase family protein [Nanoarchaeota archaeon]
MDYKKVLEELYSLDIKKWTLGLDKIENLLQKLGNPEKKLRCVHVAGTNGKGSVCAMLHSVLMDAGYKTGLYTSPHLKKFNERIRIKDKLITDKDIVKYYLKVKKHVDGQSFFEITTAMAFLYFYEKNADFAVLEVGLGGRLDATNVVMPLVSVITNVGLEHTQFLGNTIEKIAYEKAGIIKKNIPAVTAAEGIALATIKKISNEKKSPLIIINTNNIKINEIKNRKIKNKNVKNRKTKNIGKNNWAFDYNGCKNLILGPNGKFQVYNAATALGAIKILKNNYKIRINKKNIINGLKNAKWPGRMQFIGKNIMVDCAHNPSGFHILAKELRNFNYKKLIMVLGFSNDKDIKKISKIIKPLANQIILTKSGNERALEPEKIKKYFNKNLIIIKNPKTALKYAKKIAKKEDLILVAGSIFLVGELL